ncbi:hypothetical protein B0H11DRAFT_2346746 [Mycena galericulata]|nr:hypothetical protein B0H11DRAFT_2346746 [Mycena galericulata]
MSSSNETPPSAPLLREVNEIGYSTRTSWRDFLSSNVDPDHSTGLLAFYCFMTGFIDAISFTAVFVWCGFQTGNFVQLALAVARMVNDRELVFYTADWQAIASLVAFNLGAFIGRVGDWTGPQTRQWLVSGTVAQAVFTVLAAICIQQSGQGSIALARGEPSWTNGVASTGLALMAASLGLQGIMAKRLNTQFSTTVVLTAVWVELMTDPHLFRCRRITSRDHKLFALIALFGGALSARLLLGRIGTPATLVFGAGIRLMVAVGWVFVPKKSELGDNEHPRGASEAEETPTYGAAPTTAS